MTNPLDPVWAWYQTARDSMRVTTRVVQKNLQGAITSRHMFFSLPTAEAESRLEEARQELDYLVIVGMVAVFERALRDHLTGFILQHLPNTDPINSAIREQVKDDVEFWHLSARVIDEIFKKKVDSKLCGMIKNILEYRNNIAHGHAKWTVPPGDAKPSLVFERLTKFLREARVI